MKPVKVMIEPPDDFLFGILPWGEEYAEYIIRIKNTAFLTKKELKFYNKRNKNEKTKKTKKS